MTYAEQAEDEIWEGIASQGDLAPTIRVRICWEKQSKSSKGKWCRRAIEILKAQGAKYDPDSKTWLVPAAANLRALKDDAYEIVRSEN